MKALTGTPKQILWAENIRAGYAEAVQILREGVEVLRDPTEIKEVLVNPLNPAQSTTRIKHLWPDAKCEAQINATRYWHPEVEGDPYIPAKIGYITKRNRELQATGQPYDERQTTLELYELTIEALEHALETKTDARYWIDRRN